MSQALQTLSGNSKHISLFGVRGAFYLSTCIGFRLVAKIRVDVSTWIFIYKLTSIHWIVAHLKNESQL